MPGLLLVTLALQKLPKFFHCLDQFVGFPQAVQEHRHAQSEISLGGGHAFSVARVGNARQSQ